MNQNLENHLTQEAWRVFNLSIARAKHHYPQWARTSKFRRKFLKVYKKAQIKSMFSKIGEKYQVDHIVPLHGKTVSGLHVPWNLKVIPAIVNQAKGTMIVKEWI